MSALISLVRSWQYWGFQALPAGPWPSAGSLSCSATVVWLKAQKAQKRPTLAQAGRPPPPPPLLPLSVVPLLLSVVPLTVLLTFEPRSSDVTTVLSLHTHIAQASNAETLTVTENTDERWTPLTSPNETQARCLQQAQSNSSLSNESTSARRI